ncbi:MAG: hypothetical protein IIC73_07520, partial [Armatimonadetes bacterium]|nr:hypothetical protein [Armatimonadota bacterium]
MTAFVVAAMLAWGQVAPFMGPTTLEAVVEQIAVEMEIEIAVPQFLQNRLIYVNFNGGTAEELRDGLFECLDLYLVKEGEDEYSLNRRATGLPSIRTLSGIHKEQWAVYESALESLPMNPTEEQVDEAAQAILAEYRKNADRWLSATVDYDDHLVNAFAAGLDERDRMIYRTIKFFGADLAAGFGRIPSSDQVIFLTRQRYPALYDHWATNEYVAKALKLGDFGPDPVFIFSHRTSSYSVSWRASFANRTEEQGPLVRYQQPLAYSMSPLQLFGYRPAKVDLTPGDDLWSRWVDSGIEPSEGANSPSIELLPQVMKNLAIDFAAFLPQHHVSWPSNLRQISLRYLEQSVNTYLPFMFELTEGGWMRAGSADLLPLTNVVEWKPHMPAVRKHDKSERFTVSEFQRYLDGLDLRSVRQAMHIPYQNPSLYRVRNDPLFQGLPLFFIAREALREWDGEPKTWTMTVQDGPPEFRELVVAMISEGYWFARHLAHYARFWATGQVPFV